MTSERIGLFSFGFVLSDSLFTYFLKTLGHPMPTNALLPILLLMILFRWGARPLLPPLIVGSGLVLFAFSFSLGILILPEFTTQRFSTLTSALCAFLVGYFTIRHCQNERHFAFLLTGVGFCYALVCTLALLKLFPSILPLIEAISFDKGLMKIRPEITTDQNFQIFYLLPLLLPLALPMNRWRFAVITIGGLLCLFVLAQIKTRSGFLVFSGTFLMCLLVSVWMPQLGRLKIVAIPILMLAATLSSLPFILEQGAGLLERFQGSYHTFEGRVDSLSYMLTNLGNPEFWIPQGNAAYVNRTGNVPHANPTAFYLEGGLLGVFSWFLLFPLPLMATGVHYFRRRLNPVQVMALIGGAACLVIQLSLNVPLMEQVWLWGGAVVGVVPRLPVAKASASGKVAMLCHR